MDNGKLAAKNGALYPESLERLYGNTVSNELRRNGYPTESAELAILRKQIASLLEALSSEGIDASLPEFERLYADAEAAKENARKKLFIDGKK